MVGISKLAFAAAACVASASARQQIYDHQWYNSLPATAQAQYDNLAADIINFLNLEGEDFRDDDQYEGYGPIFVRAAFHAAGTFQHTTNTGGLNGEREHAFNGCIEDATEILEKYALKHKVSFTDTLIIASTLGLQEMGLPSINQIKVAGGRKDTKNDHEEDLGFHLPTSNVNPIRKFTERYGFNLEELVALTGGGHSIGAAHVKCSGFEGAWSAEPTKWGVDGKGSDFFTDMVKDYWQWFYVTHFEDDTLTYTPTDDPTFPSDRNVQHQDRGEQSITKTAAPEATKRGTERSGRETIQAMRGCRLPHKATNVEYTDTPCVDGKSRPVIRVPADFWMLKHKDMRQYALDFAASDEKFESAFAAAWQKMIDLGSDRCSALGTVCEIDEVCHKEVEDGFFVDGVCQVVGDGECNAERCPMKWRGDGVCDKMCNTEACGHDSGDCEPHNCNPGCSPSMVDDGVCQDECNNAACGFDGDDCSGDWPRDNNNDCEGRPWGDFDDCCESWAFFGKCDTLPEYMLKRCPKACKYGERYDAHAIKDWSEQCEEQAATGACERSNEYMDIVCKAACKDREEKYNEREETYNQDGEKYYY